MERWPPVYDADGLADQIKDLVDRRAVFNEFYWTAPRNVEWCQGDIIELPAEIPFLDAEGPAVIENQPISGWLLLSNTCDLDRSLEDVPYGQIVPIFNLGTEEHVALPELQALQRYSQSRRFYIPSWTTQTFHHFADLTMPVTLARTALVEARRLARLSLTSWILLHSCLIRFLARDDGRFD